MENKQKPITLRVHGIKHQSTMKLKDVLPLAILQELMKKIKETEDRKNGKSNG